MNQQQFENGEQQMAPQTSGSDAVPSQPLPPKKGNQKVIWLIVLIAVLIIGAGTAGYFYYQRNNETMAYNVLADNEKVEDYEDFLRRFPDSPHADEVRDRLAKLRTMYDEWARLANSAYVSDFERFKSNYPTSSLAKQCDLKIDSLDWQEALKTNTPEAIISPAILTAATSRKPHRHKTTSSIPKWMKRSEITSPLRCRCSTMLLEKTTKPALRPASLPS